MILDSKAPPLLSTETTASNPVIEIIKDEPDAPPSYDNIVPPSKPLTGTGHSFSQLSNYGSSSSNLTIAETWDTQSSTFPEPSLAFPEPSLASPSTSSLHIPPAFIPRHKRSWFRSKSRTVKEVREWALSQIGDLLGNRNANFDECRSVLSGCQDGLSANNITMSNFLQESLYQQHTFYYWSIVNRTHESTRFPALLSALLSFGSSLTEETRGDIRHACLLMNDQPLFQSLRCHRHFMRLPTSHEMTFGGAGLPVDDITVEEMPSAEPAFLVIMQVEQFTKRMNFEHSVELEFLAQRRAWRLAFSVPPNKEPKWDLTLTLLEHSESTPLDSWFVIEDISPASAGLSPAASKSNPPAAFKPKPPASIRMKSSMLVPLKKDKILVSLEDGSLIGSSLRSPSNSYVSGNDTLRAKLEVRLTKPGSECTIC